AKNSCGEAVSSATISYKKPVTGSKPTVDITNNCNVTVAHGTYKFSGVVLGVTSTNQIQIKVQNKVVTNAVFTQVANGYNFDVSINAEYGQTYTLEVTATNPFGSATKLCQVTTESKPDNDIVVCVPQGRTRVTMTIKESQWAQYQQMGATLGACPVVDNDIVICVPQGNTRVTMTIKESQWAAYEAKGATLGECPVDKDITICLRQGANLTTMTIKESQWAQYQQMGATLGACPVIEQDNDIVICVPQGNTNITMTIKESQWAAYQAKGATLGACQQQNVNNETDSLSNTIGSNKMIICVVENGVQVTKEINKLEWANYKRKGATEGPCPTSNVIKRPTNVIDGNIKTNTENKVESTKRPITNTTPINRPKSSGGR
ncbi:MAG TPA: hypothetical protein PKN22_09315, partial [Taishania sp.]|nr:hypothetical protein [Taishania sp.]